MEANPFECPICFEVYDGTEHIPTTTVCGHSFCISHVALMTECFICRASILHHSLLRPTYALRDGALLYKQLSGLREEPQLLYPTLKDEKDRQIQADEEFARSLQEAEDARAPQYDMTAAIKPLLQVPSHARGASAPVLPRPFLTGDPTNASNNRGSATSQVGIRAGSERKSCGHICCKSALRSCCACMDRRPMADFYPKYVDGNGWVSSAPRHAGYCPFCKPSG